MYLLETANIMNLSFIRFQLLSFGHGNSISHKNVKYNSVALLLGYNQVFFSAIGTRFPCHLFSRHFVHIWKASLVFIIKIDSSIFGCAS